MRFTDGVLTVEASADLGVYNIPIRAVISDGDISTSVESVLNVIVKNAAPILDSSDISVTGIPGDSINAIVIANSGTNLEWTINGILPQNFSTSFDDRTFAINGTPVLDDAGKIFDVIVRASNDQGVANCNVRIIIRNIAPELVTDIQTLNATPQRPIDAIVITAKSGTNLEWSTSGTLPAGITGKVANDNASFMINGTPEISAAGEIFYYTIKASNDVGISSVRVAIDVAEIEIEIDPVISHDVDEPVAVEPVTVDEVSSMSAQEKESITEVVLTGDITDLSDILAELPNIEALTLSDTHIQEISLGENTHLKFIEAKSCPELEEVNLAGCTELEYLDISEGSVSRLNVDGCVSLRELYCSGNRLLKLDVADSILMQELDCGNQNVHNWQATQNFNMHELLDNSGEISASEIEVGENSDAGRITNLRAYDESGNEIRVEYDASTGEVNFAAVPEYFAYDYVTGFADVAMDVTVHASSSGNHATDTDTDTDTDTITNSESRSGTSSGCNSGFGVFMIILATFALVKRHG